MTDRVSQVAGVQIVWMLLVQRDEAEHVPRFDQDHNQFGRLNELVRIERACPEVQFRNTAGDWIIDVAPVVGFQNFFRGPGLVRRIRPAPDGRAPGFWYTNSLVGLRPGANPVAARLPYSGEIRLSIRCTGHGWCRLGGLRITLGRFVLGSHVRRSKKNRQPSHNARKRVTSHDRSPLLLSSSLARAMDWDAGSNPFLRAARGA